jgi:hypothetical protein
MIIATFKQILSQHSLQYENILDLYITVIERTYFFGHRDWNRLSSFLVTRYIEENRLHGEG